MSEHIEQRHMTLTRAEFLRSLQPLRRYYDCAIQPSEREITLRDGPGQVRILLGVETVRSQGALKLPSLEVQLCFSGLDAASLAAFQHRFDLSFRRGGG